MSLVAALNNLSVKNNNVPTRSIPNIQPVKNDSVNNNSTITIIKEYTPTLEELQKGYEMHNKRKQKQCEYQKKYMEKKKTRVEDLEDTNQKLQEQIVILTSYHQVFELLTSHYPQIAEQLVNHLASQRNLTNIAVTSYQY